MQLQFCAFGQSGRDRVVLRAGPGLDHASRVYRGSADCAGKLRYDIACIPSPQDKRSACLLQVLSQRAETMMQPPPMRSAHWPAAGGSVVQDIDR